MVAPAGLLNRRGSYAEEAPRNQDGGYFIKTVNARDLQKRINECVDISQQDKVVITRHGKPAAVLVGVEGKDWADVACKPRRASGS
jgi:prevent-host-death family protein